MARRRNARAWPANGTASGSAVPRRRGCVHGVEIDSESVLYDAANRRLHLLNWSASAVWWSIDGTTTADGLADDLADSLGAAHQTLRDDVSGLLAMLASRQLIEAAAPPDRRPTRA